MAHGPRSFNEARGSSGAALQQILSREDRNIVGGGFGRRTTAGVRLSTPACVVYVVRKLPADALPRERLLPRTMEVNGVTVEVDVEETGPFRALEYTDRYDRPVRSGVSIGNVESDGWGTFGCLVRDMANGGQLSILSNWHVLVGRRNAARGERITQPGTSSIDKDTIGTLARWIDLDWVGDNQVDCAIAHVSKSSDVANMTMGDQAVVKVPSGSQPAVGLLFAGSGTRTLMNPIGTVLNRLNLQLLDRGAYEGYEKGDEVFRISVAKSGARTEVTRSNMQEIDVTANVVYDGLGRARFVHQISANVMSCPGDSGSLVCRVPPAPAYGRVPCAEPSSCAFLGTAERMTGIPFSQEGDLVRTARDKYLAQTKVGRWLIDMVYVNQQALFERGENTQVQAGDRALAQALYTKYLGEVKLAIADPSRDDLRLTTAHLTDVQGALTSLKKYLTEQEAGAADVLYNMLQGQVGKKPSELIAMLDDPGVHQTVITLFGEAPFLADPYTG